ncbi:DoxX family protein [Luteolibacter algae]|uniref:DoxX family protein n=1 Tax=Luteolibacter algae TaxID=454151 RepID=A0ABW5D4F7_9BACT
MKKFFFDCGTRDSTASLGILFLRVCTGLMLLIGHGLGKIQNFEMMKEKFPVPDFFPLRHMSPFFSLISTIGVEVGCAGLIVLGIATRPAAFILAFTMTVAAFNIHNSDPWFMGPGVEGAKELALLYLIPSVAILLTGAGAYSADASIYKEGRRRRW